MTHEEALLLREELRRVLRYARAAGCFVWCASPSHRAVIGARAGSQTKGGYWAIGYKRNQYYVHRLVWLFEHGEWPAAEIDHINGDPSDNRISNLRQATHQQNNHNRARNKTRTTPKGVDCQPSDMYPYRPWRARIKVGDRRITLGYFATPEEASSAYKAAAEKHFGEFARAA